MSNTSKPRRRGLVFPLSLGVKLRAQLKEMAEHWDISSSDVIRRALTAKYLEMIRERGGYYAGAHQLGKHARHEETTAFSTQLETLPDEALLALLLEIGYIEPACEKPENPGVVNEFKIEGGALKRYVTQTWLPGKAPDVYVVFANREELILDIKKEIKRGRVKIPPAV